ncbi:holo-ACP synthase [Mycolicibacterium hodleri]|uniref:holo-ACP synthase n=1 Tax=Mycolicibacterium hodleri TaxID=49897 RepID=UPI0021F2FF79|nr:holo-ACP synthase [Mycolicibacterium hodleri]
MGCDLVELAEVENSVATFGTRYLRRIFTDSELDECSGPTHIARLAARFAAKEAAVKAFAVPESAFVPKEIEVVSNQSVPRLQLSGAAARLAALQGWSDVSLSLSHTACHAAAVLVAVCIAPARSAPEHL